MNDITSKLAEALKLLLSYTKSCEALLNCSPAGQIALADAALAAYEQAQAEPLTAMQARSVVDGMGWALDEVKTEDMEMLVKAAESACAEAWGVKL